MKRKWTDEDLVLAVKDSYSFNQVMMKLGIKSGGATLKNLRGHIERLNLDISHFNLSGVCLPGQERGNQKYCSFHNAIEPLEGFVKNNTTRDGRGGICNEAAKIVNKNHRKYWEYQTLYKVVRHGITLDEHSAMVIARNNVCDICKKEQIGKRLSIDHDHRCCEKTYSCGKCIRGLLCEKCNRALGLFGDDPMILQNAVNYLKGLT